MTYCAAWKKHGKVFLIADSVTSTLNKPDSKSISSFGEVEGLYSNYWTRETSQKILKINDFLAVAYSCEDETVVLEAISYLKYVDQMPLPAILQMICNTYTNGFDLLIISKINNVNKIYHIHNAKYKEIDDFVDIGSGKTIPNLSKSFKEIIANYGEPHQSNYGIYLSDILSTIQCISIKNDFIRYGVGGMFFGIYLDYELEWSRDMLFHVTHGGDNKNLVSVICRNNTIYYASSFNEGIRYFFDGFIKEKVKENPYLLEAIVKTINTVVPYYIIYFDKLYNSRVMVIIKGYSSTDGIKFWIKRRSNEVKYAILTSPLITQYLEDGSASNDFVPSRYIVDSPKTSYVGREEFIKHLNLDKVVQDLDQIYDLDFQYINFLGKAAIDEVIPQHISNYRNIVVIDGKYLDTLINEKISYYKQINENISLNLEPIVSKFSTQIASDIFEDYAILILATDEVSEYLNTVLYDEWKNNYSNLFIIKDLNSHYLAINIFSIVKSYYLNESFFHLDKLILFCDDEKVDEVLQLVPQSNFEMENVDIILIREINGLTKMDGRFRYTVADYIIGAMFGLTHDEIAYAEALIGEDLSYLD
ncbi:hypothetical protein ACQCU1_20795 [Sutcliffiella horikoshii]|uniref:hypothetical protein n=1 Tax=Sutcliffiella horikoshii TaxID=79883 RepID=UPI003CF0BA91